MKNALKKVTIIVSSLLMFLILNSLISGIFAYNAMFKNTARPDYKVTPGLIEYKDIQKNYERQLYKYKSDNATLCGYYYPNDNAKAMVVMVHGLNDGADALLSSICYFLDNDYCVFAYDCTGCFDSDGDFKGFNQSVIDLQYTLSYLNTDSKFSFYEKLLFGFSMGGYATTSIFNLNDFDVCGSVSISGFNDVSDVFLTKAYNYVGPLAYVGLPSMDIITSIRFNNYAKLNSVDGINKTNTPIFIAHSIDDDIISYNKESIISQKENITNKNVTYYILENKSHNETLYSKNAIIYQKEVKKNIKNKKDEIKTYISSVNDFLYNELDTKLFNSILTFYDNCLKTTE